MLFLEIKVVVQSGRNQLIVDKSGTLKCYIKSAPEQGKANKEVIEIVSHILQVSKKSVEIVSGLTSRKKLLKIQTDLSYEQVLRLLGAGHQTKIF